MNSSIPTPAPLTAAEEAEIDEYERIVAFAEQVMAGTHPRVRIPDHLRAQIQAQATTTVVSPSALLPSSLSPRLTLSIAATPANAADESPPARRVPVFNTAHDHYKALGIEIHSSAVSIDRAYQAKMDLYGPDAAAAQHKYASDNPNVVRAVKAACFRVTRAYNILSDSELRREYDAARAVAVARNKPVWRGRGRGRGGRGNRVTGRA